jgi:hypothetical protein
MPEPMVIPPTLPDVGRVAQFKTEQRSAEEHFWEICGFGGAIRHPLRYGQNVKSFISKSMDRHFTLYQVIFNTELELKLRFYAKQQA